MRKVAKPLKMKNGVMARTIDEVKSNFDVKKILGYYLDGELRNWLEARGYEEELEKVKQLSKNDSDIAKKICDIFEVQYIEESGIDIEIILKEKERTQKIKQFTDDEEILVRINCVAFNQEEFDELYDKGVEHIYLCEGSFEIPKSKKHVIEDVFGNANIVYSKSEKEEDAIPSELADLLYNKNYIELKDYVVWTEHGTISERERTQYEKYFQRKKTSDMTKRFKVWSKLLDTYYSFDIPTVVFPRFVGEFISYKNLIIVNDCVGHVYSYNMDSGETEQIYKNLYVIENKCIPDDEKFFYLDEDYNSRLLDLETKEDKVVESHGAKRYYVGDWIFSLGKDAIYIYDVDKHQTRKLYQFKKDVELFQPQMFWYDDELFVICGSYTKKLIGITLDGVFKEYFSISNAYTMRVLHDEAVRNKSNYLVFEMSEDVYVFDMDTRELRKHNNCTRFQDTYVVENFLYIDVGLQPHRVDLNESWNPIQIDTE